MGLIISSLQLQEIYNLVNINEKNPQFDFIVKNLKYSHIHNIIGKPFEPLADSNEFS
jgi:hypothetical protein